MYIDTDIYVIHLWFGIKWNEFVTLQIAWIQVYVWKQVRLDKRFFYFSVTISLPLNHWSKCALKEASGIKLSRYLFYEHVLRLLMHYCILLIIHILIQGWMILWLFGQTNSNYHLRLLLNIAYDNVALNNVWTQSSIYALSSKFLFNFK